MAGDEHPEVELARDVVAALAPNELPLFPAVVQALEGDRTGKGLLRGGDDILGFGASEAATFLAPVALMAAKEVMTCLAAEIAKEVAGGITARLRSLIRREAPGAGLGPPQLAEVRVKVEAVALKARLPKAKAKALADEFVKRLREP